MWDVAYSKKVAADADARSRDCVLMCEKSGFGIVTADKRFLKFDADGNAKNRRGAKVLRQDGPSAGERLRRCRGRHDQGDFSKTALVFSEDAPTSIPRGWGICLGMLMVGLEDDLQCELRVEGLAGSDGGVA
jgi:hypothetical protein